MKLRFVWLATVGLSSCAATPQQPAYHPTISQAAYKLTPAENRVVDEGVRKSLKDPFSAVFGSRFASKGEGGAIYVCGHVNARNSFGGYVGDQIFYGMLAGVDGKPLSFGTIGIAGTPIDYTVARQMCASWAIFIQ